MANKGWHQLASVKSTVLCLILFLLLVQQSTSQTFTPRERELILERHRQRLDREALAVFEEKIKAGGGDGGLIGGGGGRRRDTRSTGVGVIGTGAVSGTGSENNFHLLMNYDGLYEPLTLDSNNISWSGFSCDGGLGDQQQQKPPLLSSPLIGVDYRRHADRHYLLCFTAEALLLRTFQLQQGTELRLDPTYSLRRIDQDESSSNGGSGGGSSLIKQALFYRHYDTGRLFIGVLAQRGLLYSLLTYEVATEPRADQHTPKTRVVAAVPAISPHGPFPAHRFALGETVAAIESLHYGLNSHKLVALLTGANFEVEAASLTDSSIIKLTMPGASLLKTMRITTQGFIIAANGSHWGAFRVAETEAERVALYRSYSAIVDLQTMAFGDSTRQQYVAVVAQYHQMIYRWEGEGVGVGVGTFKPSTKMLNPAVYRMNTLRVSYLREDLLFYFDQHEQQLSPALPSLLSNETVVYGFDSNSELFIRVTSMPRPLRGLPPSLTFAPLYDVHFSQAQVAFQIKVAAPAAAAAAASGHHYHHQLYLFAFHTRIEDSSSSYFGGKQGRSPQQQRRDPRPDIAGLQLIAERATMEHKLNNMLQATSSFERTETLSRRPVNVTFTFAVRLQSRIITKRLVVDQDGGSARSASETTSHPSFPSQWIINKRRFNGSDILVRLDKLRHLLPLVANRSRLVKQELDTDVVYRHSRSLAIPAFKEFVNPMVAVPMIEARESVIDLYRRGQYVGELLAKMYRLGAGAPPGADVLIRGTKLLAVNNVAVHAFLRLGRLNGARLEDYLYGGLAQEVHAQLWYRRLTVETLQLASDQLAANVSLSRAVFINQAGSPPLTIRNRAIFSSLDVGRLTVDRVDHLDMSRLPGQVLRRSVTGQQAQIFRLPTRMARLQVTGAGGGLTTELLNGRNASAVFANLVRRSGVVHLQAPVRIVGDARIASLFTDGQLNGVRVPEDLLDGFSDQTIHGVKKFSRLAVKNLQTAELNRLKVPKDVITLSRDEIIPGHLNLDALRLGGSLQVENGLVDGINITHLDQRYIARLAGHYHNLTFYKPVRVKTLKVAGGHGSNGVNLEEAYADAVFNNSHGTLQAPVHIAGTKVIGSMLRCGELQAVAVNGQSTANYVTTFQPAAFPAQAAVTFWGPVQFGDVALRGTLDGVRVEHLLSSVAQHRRGQRTRVLHGRKRFSEVVHADRLVVTGTINGIAPRHFMLYSTEQNITGRKSFSEASFARLVAATTTTATTTATSNLQLTGLLNGANFSTLTSQQIVWLRVPRLLDTTAAAGFYCGNCSAVNVNAQVVNGRNFTYWVRHYLSKSRPQTVTGRMHFKGVQSFVELSSRSGLVAGINMEEIREQAVTLHGHNIIRQRLVLHDDLVLANGRLMAGTYNDINVSEFYQKAVHSNHTDVVTIHGRTIFGRGFDLHADMRADLLNGVPPERLLMTKTGNYEVKSTVTFSGRVVTSGDVRVKTALNGLDLARLDASMLKVNDRGEVDGSVNFLSPVEVAEVVAVQGLVDGIPLSRETVLMADGGSGSGGQSLNRLILDGPSHFTEDLHVLGNINGYAQENLGKIVMARSGERQVINASKTFARNIEAVEIRQLAGDVRIQVLNGVPLAHFERNAVYVSAAEGAANRSSSSSQQKVIKAQKHFYQNVTLATRQVTLRGTVNGVDLLREVIRLDGLVNQTVTGVKTFERVHLNEDIDVHGQVNALDLPAIHRSVLYTVGQQEVPRPVVFKAPLYLAADSHVDRLNHLPPSSLLTLAGDQHIAGELRFGTAKATSVTSATVNGVNLTDVAQHVLYKSSPAPQRVQATLVVNTARFEGDVALKYHLNRVDLNVAVEAAKANLHQQFADVQQVAKTISSSAAKLKQHQLRIDYARFAIQYLVPSKLQVEQLYHQKATLAAAKFDYLFGQQIGQAVYASLMTYEAATTTTTTTTTTTKTFTTTYQPFTFRTHFYVAVIESPNRVKSESAPMMMRSTLRLLAIIWDPRTGTPLFEQKYAEVFSSNLKTLVFTMDDSLYILYGSRVTACCAGIAGNNNNNNSTTGSYLKRLLVSTTTGHFSSPQSSAIVQQFSNEEAVRSIGHFTDGQGYHHLLFSSQQVSVGERRLTVYKRMAGTSAADSCHFEAVQRLEVARGRLMALFKFGLPNLLEQYLLVLERRQLTLLKHQGVNGFAQRWTAPASYLPVSGDDDDDDEADSLGQALTPFLLNTAHNSTRPQQQQQFQRLFFNTPSCPDPVFEAVLSGRFNGLQLFYDDFY